MRLKDKAAIITGAASGIGKACATAFAREGARVVILDIQEEQGAISEKEIKGFGGEASFIKTDVTVLTEIENAVEETIEKYGKIDVLMNNAGSGSFFDLHEMDEKKDFDFIFDLNIKSYFRFCKLVIPYMVRNNGGSIINVASVGGITAMPKMASYGATKAAIIEFSKTVAVEYADRNIRCNTILPGAINTALKVPDSFVDQMVPLKRLGEPEEVAAAAVFFASDECPHCTGASLVIDGGITCGPYIK